jgi:threonine dehydrogenase-like Zn-dependent dehydrogenase
MQNLPDGMPSLVWEAPRRMTLQQAPLPVLQPEDVLIRVAYAGICGSELSGYLGHNALRVPPLVMGHEFSGEIAALGEQALTHNPRLKLGQRVTANPMIYCGKCDYCQSGDTHLCSSRRLVGAHRPGAFAGYTTVPAWMVIPLPDGVDLRKAALTEPVAVSVRIAAAAGNVQGETMLITGAGTVGILTLQLLQQNGAARIFITDTDPDRLAVAASLGGEALNPLEADVAQAVRAATGGKGAAAAVDAVGKAVTRDQCVKSVRPGGSVILSGLHEETSTHARRRCHPPRDPPARLLLLYPARFRSRRGTAGPRQHPPGPVDRGSAACQWRRLVRYPVQRAPR